MNKMEIEKVAHNIWEGSPDPFLTVEIIRKKIKEEIDAQTSIYLQSLADNPTSGHDRTTQGAEGIPDQTIKADAGKFRPALVPPQAIMDIAEVREFGLRKYGDKESWKKVNPDRYINALFRHLLHVVKNPQWVDEESGIKAYKHLACNAAFLCELLKEDKDGK